MEISMQGNTRNENTQRAKRSLVVLGIMSIVMLFAGLTSGYIVRQGEGKWAEFALPNTFIYSTIIIVLSSLPMQWALISIRRNNVKNLISGLALSGILGFAFIFTQYLAWSELFQSGIAFTGRIRDVTTNFNYIPAGVETVEQAGDAGNVAGSFLYVITGLHVVHLLAGIIALFIVFSRAIRQKYSSADYNGVKMCTIYWHFLSGLWLYLFFFLLYIR
ncbi:MAG: cytochrome c oxidase subunit 3 [Bacteroidia bacterium]|nr:cytochrome c oxidase subunit 3 [Bacteroidia bacterium]